MDLVLNEEQEMLARSAREFVNDPTRLASLSNDKVARVLAILRQANAIVSRHARVSPVLCSGACVSSLPAMIDALWAAFDHTGGEQYGEEKLEQLRQLAADLGDLLVTEAAPGPFVIRWLRSKLRAASPAVDLPA